MEHGDLNQEMSRFCSCWVIFFAEKMITIDHMGFKIKKLVDLTRANQPRSRFELSKLLNKQNINLVGGFNHLETY